MSTDLSNQLRHDFQEAPEPANFKATEDFLAQFAIVERAYEKLIELADGAEKSEVRLKLDSLHERTVWDLSEYDGPIFEPHQELAKLSPNMAILWRSDLYWVEEMVSRRLVCGGLTPGLAVHRARKVMGEFTSRNARGD